MSDSFFRELHVSLRELPISELRVRMAQTCEKLMRELFREDVRQAEHDDFGPIEAIEPTDLSNLGKSSDPAETKSLSLKLLRSDFIYLWNDAHDTHEFTSEYFITGVDSIWENLEFAGYSDQDVEKYFSYFLEPSKAEAG